MKAFFSEHKFYIVTAFIIALGGMYYFFIYQEEQPPNQTITEIGNSPDAQEQASKQNEPKPDSAKAETVMVDVKGEIKQPGVYSSNLSERVIDVIQRAGGLTNKADSSQVNFAAHVQDAMVIYIPATGEVATSNSQIPNTAQPAGTSDSGGKNGANQNGKININRADVNELQNLPGIGPAKAASIIQYREENGPFQAVEDLKKISGIGEKTFEKLKESISLQ